VVSLISAILGAAVPLLLYARKNKADAELTELQKIKLVLDEVQEERDKLRTYANELKSVIDNYNGKIREYQSERGLLIKTINTHEGKIAQLEKDIVEKERTIAVIEETTKVRDNRLDDKIKAVDRRTTGALSLAQQVKDDTGELKKQLRETGTLLEQNKKE